MNNWIPDSSLQRLARFPHAVIASMLATSLLSATSARASEQPKLVVQITIDALRGDLPDRFSNVLGKGGFRYLMEQGIYYTNANYQQKISPHSLRHGCATHMLELGVDLQEIQRIPGHARPETTARILVCCRENAFRIW